MENDEITFSDNKDNVIQQVIVETKDYKPMNSGTSLEEIIITEETVLNWEVK